MCDYIIKHYWDEETKSATLEPKWLTSGEKLTKNQQIIKNIYLGTLGNATYYNNLAEKKLSEEVRNGYQIRYSYVDKDDPLNKKSNTSSRMATDITMCLTKQKNHSRILWMFLLIVGITIIVSIFNMLDMNKNSGKEILSSNQQISSPLEVENEINKIKKVQKTAYQKLKDEICGNEKIDKAIKIQENCLEFYLEKRCVDEVSVTYKEWLKQVKYPECTGIKGLKDESSTIRALDLKKSIEKKLYKFAEGVTDEKK